MIDNDLLFRYEDGDLSEDEIVKLFQQIYDTQAYKWLQGHYGRMLGSLIEDGLITSLEDAMESGEYDDLI